MGDLSQAGRMKTGAFWLNVGLQYRARDKPQTKRRRSFDATPLWQPPAKASNEPRDEDPTHREIAEYLGVTTARATQIINTALRKLRHPSRARLLREFYYDHYIGRPNDNGDEDESGL